VGEEGGELFSAATRTTLSPHIMRRLGAWAAGVEPRTSSLEAHIVRHTESDKSE